MFGQKTPHKTVLILDIENGSVASSLMRLSPGAAPHLFGERRVATPLLDTRSAATLMRAVEHAASESLLHAAEVSARLRHHASALPPVSKVVIFLAAPWGVPNLAEGRPDFSHSLLDILAPRVQALFGSVPTSLHAHASAAVHGLRTLYPTIPSALVLSVNGEMSELLSLEDGHVVAHATAPVGAGHVLRTLKSHAGVNLAEARSMITLMQGGEAASAAAAHFAGEFKEVARELMQSSPTDTVFVLAHEPSPEWFARALEQRSLADLFPQGGVVRTLRAGQFAPLVGSQGGDTHLLLNALYTSAAHRA